MGFMIKEVGTKTVGSILLSLFFIFSGFLSFSLFIPSLFSFFSFESKFFGVKGMIGTPDGTK